jgi:hypothetical protein
MRPASIGIGIGSTVTGGGIDVLLAVVRHPPYVLYYVGWGLLGVGVMILLREAHAWLQTRIAESGFHRWRRAPATQLQDELASRRAEAVELRNRLRHLPPDEAWRQHEYLVAISDQIKDDWFSRLCKTFGDAGALELRNEFMRLPPVFGEALYQRESLIGYMNDAIKLLTQMQNRLGKPLRGSSRLSYAPRATSANR